MGLTPPGFIVLFVSLTSSLLQQKLPLPSQHCLLSASRTFWSLWASHFSFLCIIFQREVEEITSYITGASFCFLFPLCTQIVVQVYFRCLFLHSFCWQVCPQELYEANGVGCPWFILIGDNRGPVKKWNKRYNHSGTLRENPDAKILKSER